VKAAAFIASALDKISRRANNGVYAQRGILNRKWVVPQERLPGPPLFVAVFVALTALLCFLILQFHLPHALLFLLAPLCLLAIFRYPSWAAGSLLGISFVTIVSLDALSSPDFTATVANTLLMSAGLCGLGLFFWWMVERQRHRESRLQDRFSAVADTSYFLETWQRPDDSFEYVSPSSEIITGYPADDFYQYPRLFYEIIHPEDRRLVEEAHQNMRRRGRSAQSLEFRILHRNGKVRWIEQHFRPLYTKEDTYRGRRATCLDITDKKVGLEALRAKFDRLMAAIEGTEDGVWDINLQDGSLYFTPQYAHLLGPRFERPDACLKDLYSIIHPEDMPAVLQAFKDHMQWKTPHYQAEYRLLTSQGKWRWVLARGKIIEQDSSG